MSLLLTEEALSKLSLPPAVLRKAQQLPGIILLPNGQEVAPCSSKCPPLPGRAQAPQAGR